MSDNKIEITILNEKYTLKGDSDHRVMKEAANMVNKKMEQLHSLYPRLSVNRLAILTALNIAEELIKTRYRK